MTTKHLEDNLKIKDRLLKVICLVADNMWRVNPLFLIPVIQKVCVDFIFNLINFFIHFSCVISAIDTDSRYLSADEQNRELTRSIRREIAKLSEQWNNLIDRSDHWKHRLDEYMTVSFFFFDYLLFRIFYHIVQSNLIIILI